MKIFSKRNVNIIFLVIFLIEIISGIIGMNELAIETDYLIVLVSIIFVSGIHTIVEKKRLYFLAFCIINITQSIILIDIVHEDMNFYSKFQDKYDLQDFLSRTKKAHIVKEFLKNFDNSTNFKLEYEKEYVATFVIPNILVFALIIFFDILFIILLVIIWKKKYWNAVKILIPEKLVKRYNIYKIHKFLLYITLFFIAEHNCFLLIFADIYSFLNMEDNIYLGIFVTFIIMLPFYTLTFGSKIIKKELRIHIFLIYGALIGQSVILIYYHLILDVKFMNSTAIILLGLLFINFINTILCHLNFGKDLKLYLMFDPELGKEFEYSNNLNSYNEYSDDINKDKTYFEMLKCCWKSIKNILKNIFISPIIYLIEYNHIKEV